MRMRFRATAAALLMTLAMALGAGCTSILGVTDVPDATAGDDDSGQVPTDATSPDASLPSSEAGPPGSDASMTTQSDGATTPEGGGTTHPEGGMIVTTCTADGGACKPAEDCHSGALTCGDGGEACAAAGLLNDGTPCGTDSTHFCLSGLCAVCNAGGDCSSASTPCVVSTYDCSNGSPVCKFSRNATEGMACGGSGATAMYCNMGICAACKVGAACAPSTNPCHVGSITACTGGVATCMDTNAAAMDGTSCTSGTTTGVCSVGTCTACTTSASCNPGGNPCQNGTMSCSTGPKCGFTTNVQDGTTLAACGTNEICLSGACAVKCDAASCAGCCNGNTCVPVASETSGMCGTGTAGASCGTCSAGSCTGGSCQCPTGTIASGSQCVCNASSSCSGCCSSATACEPFASESPTSCGGSGAICKPCGTNQACNTSGSCVCSSSFPTTCGTACVNLMTDGSNCGTCAHSCLNGTCSTGVCQPYALATVAGLTGGLLLDPNGVYSADITGTGPANGGGEARSFNALTGATITTSTDNRAGTFITQDAAHIYAVTNDPNNGKVIVGYTKANLASGGIVLLYSGFESLGFAGSNGTDVFWTALDISANMNFSIESAVDGTLVGSNLDPPLGGPLVGDTFGIVFVPASGLAAYDASFSTMTTLKTPTGVSPGAMVLDPSNVYYIDKSTLIISASARDGSSLIKIDATPLVRAPIQLAVDLVPGPNQFVYWVDPPAGTVSKAPAAGGAATATLVATGQSGLTGGVAADSTAIYFSTGTALMKVAK